MKKVTTTIASVMLLFSVSHAQLIISDFTTFTSPSFGGAGGGSFDNTGVVSIDDTGGTSIFIGGDANTGSFGLGGLTDVYDFSAYDSFELTATATLGGNSSTLYSFQLVNAAAQVVAFTTFTSSSLTGGAVTQAWSLTGNGSLSQIANFQVSGSGVPSATWNISFDEVSAVTTVPEPSTITLFGMALAAIVFRRRR